MLLPADKFNDEIAGHLSDTIRRHFQYRLSRHIQTMNMACHEGKISCIIAISTIVVLVLLVSWLYPYYIEDFAAVLLIRFFHYLKGGNHLGHLRVFCL